ncbi:hypothetical protein FOL47_008242 [Perkinsus chesapeaki]|uniref:Poly(A) RNA polymerase mitochondrial-like central palm domain-containing protein n=1 Tax=Perkinsus chesapeaki TaxID=330153 RepID=A0A7J6LF64_PERCH|nr:hypothetical protein FOL47_008242 [Perkinsus chesapeaki]
MTSEFNNNYNQRKDSRGYMRTLVEYLSRCGVGRTALETGVWTAGDDDEPVEVMYRVKLKCYPLEEFCEGEGDSEDDAMEDAAKKVLDVLDGKQLLEARGRRLQLMLKKYGGEEAVVSNGGINMKDLVKKSKDIGSPYYTLLEDSSDSEVDLHSASVLVLQSLLASPTTESLYEDATAFLRKLGGSMPSWVVVDAPPPFLLAAVHWSLLAVVTGQVDEVVPQTQEITMTCLLVLEHVYLSWAAKFPGFNQFASELIRYILVTRKAPVIAKTRLESYELQGLPSDAARDVALPYRKIACTEAPDADEELMALAEYMIPCEEKLEWLHRQLNEVNEILLSSPLAAEGKVYGSLVNGFPTAHSDIDVVIELREDVKEELLANAAAKKAAEEEEEGGTDGSGGDSDDGEGEEEEMAARKKDRKATIAAIEMLGELFDQHGYGVNEVVTARVPILLLVKEAIGEDGEKEKVEFNLSFDHQIPLYNSKLLRCYAMLRPEIVRTLVVLVKHWAKTRDVNDALNGTLSSYSYVLLVVFFLQQKGILPSLQDPRCFRNVKKEWIIDRYVDSEKHHVYFFDWLSSGVTDPNEALKRFFLPRYSRAPVPSMSRLLYEFFDFYTSVFPSYDDVVDIRSVDHRVSKEAYFKSELSKMLARVELGGDDGDEQHIPTTIEALTSLRRRRAWLAIADPFENLRLLGVSPRGMERLMQGMRRAVALLDHPRTKVSAIEKLFSTKKSARGRREFDHPRKAIDRAAHNWGTYHDNSLETIREKAEVLFLVSFIYYNSNESPVNFCRNPALDDATTWMAVSRAWTWATRGVQLRDAKLRYDIFCCLTMLEGINVASKECIEALPGHRLVSNNVEGCDEPELGVDVVCNMQQFNQALTNARTIRRSPPAPPPPQQHQQTSASRNGSSSSWRNDPDYHRPQSRGNRQLYKTTTRKYGNAPEVRARHGEQEEGRKAEVDEQGFHVKRKGKGYSAGHHRRYANLDSILEEEESSAVLEDAPAESDREVRRRGSLGRVGPISSSLGSRSQKAPDRVEVSKVGARPSGDVRSKRSQGSNFLSVPNSSMFKSQVLRTPKSTNKPSDAATPRTTATSLTTGLGRSSPKQPRPASLIISRSLLDDEEVEEPPEALLSMSKNGGHVSVTPFTPNHATPLASSYLPSCRANDYIMSAAISPVGSIGPSSNGIDTGEGLCNRISEKCFTQHAQWNRAVEEVRRAVKRSVAKQGSASAIELIADLLREGGNELYGFWSLSERSLMPMIDLIMGNNNKRIEASILGKIGSDPGIGTKSDGSGELTDEGGGPAQCSWSSRQWKRLLALIGMDKPWDAKKTCFVIMDSTFLSISLAYGLYVR